MKLNHDCIRSVMLVLEKGIAIDENMCLQGVSVESCGNCFPNTVIRIFCTRLEN